MPPPWQGTCVMAVPGCLLQQADEEGEIKGGFQQMPFSCPEVSLVLPAGKSHTRFALSNGFNSKLLLAQLHLSLALFLYDPACPVSLISCRSWAVAAAAPWEQRGL